MNNFSVLESVVNIEEDYRLAQKMRDFLKVLKSSDTHFVPFGHPKNSC
jgi:hypothetical protein